MCFEIHQGEVWIFPNRDFLPFKEGLVCDLSSYLNDLVLGCGVSGLN